MKYHIHIVPVYVYFILQENKDSSTPIYSYLLSCIEHVYIITCTVYVA